MPSSTFQPFDRGDFVKMRSVAHGSMPPALKAKIDTLRQSLGACPEFDLRTFSTRIVRRPGMRGDAGLVFGQARPADQHWYTYVVGGDQDEVQLNIGMFETHLRVGLGFQMGRQAKPKIPAFRLFQLFLGLRPPIPFRTALHECIEQHKFSLEVRGEPHFNLVGRAEGVIRFLETYSPPADEEPIFVFVGALWKPKEAATKSAEDFRAVFRTLLPFYEAIILMGGRFSYFD